MREISFDRNGTRYVRIDKRNARRAYDFGCELAFCPCNLRPGSPWHPEIWVDPTSADLQGATFDGISNTFEWYNCNHECGYYAAYYIAADDLDGMPRDRCERNAFENACDCLYYGYGSTSWNDCGIDPDRRKPIWMAAYRRLESGYRY